ncbi:MAG: HAMP domain-containing sensor histidine kinase [Candidatus Zixiibacteriota bacterium]
MKNTTQNIRFGFIIFLTLVVFCIAQLTWWVIFQISQSKIDYNSQINLLEKQMKFTIDRINIDFRRIANIMTYQYELLTDSDRFSPLFDSVDRQKSILVGYSLIFKNGQKEINGIIDSTFYTAINDNLTIYLNPRYANALLGENASDYTINTIGRHNGQNNLWFDSSMISISSEKSSFLRDESRSRVKMFVSEGSIFFIVMIIGAYLIYRTLQKSEELKRQQVNFMHAVTHELRTPLTSLKLYLETLLGGNINPDKINNVYNKMLSDCDRLDTMIDNVLEAGRLDTNKHGFNFEKTNLSKELASCLDEMENYIRQQNGVLSSNIEPDIYAKTDYQALNTAIKAIIENGLKYSPPDRRIISVNLEKDGRYAYLEISDKGFGIPLTEIDNIFDRFYRINNDYTKRVKGTGLGLYITSQIIKAHQGKIKVESGGENRGTTFTIRLLAE